MTGWAAAAMAGLVAGCAHVAPPQAPVEPVVWPGPPDPARVRLALVVTSPEGPAPARSFWRRAWRAVVGVEDGEASLQFRRPFGVAMTAGGDLVIVDPDAALVVRTVPGAASRLLGCRDRPWAAPMAVAASGDGGIYVADAGEGVVVRVEADGRCTPLGAGHLERPTGVAAGGGRVFVADPPRHQIVVLSGTGEVLARIGAHGDGAGGLNFPTGVALDAAGDLLVVDALNFRIARFSADGRWLGAFGTTVGDGGQFAMPKGVAAGPDGRIYVSDAQRDVVLVFRPDGSFDYVLGASGGEPGRFTHPAGLASSGRRLYVADSYARRIQAFDVIGAAP